jgi:hypothetical protein
MDIGVNAVFEFTGTPPFRVHWTEQRKGSRLVEQSRKFDAHHGEVILQPEHEGQYTYVSPLVSRRTGLISDIQRRQRQALFRHQARRETHYTDCPPTSQRRHSRSTKWYYPPKALFLLW